MKRKLFSVMAVFLAVICLVTALFLLTDRTENPQEIRSEQVIAANEIEQLIRTGEYELAAQKASQQQESLRQMDVAAQNSSRTLLMGGLALAFVFAVFGYVYLAILRPFEKMQGFAQRLARGDFNVPLDYARSNYFGAFTWAFDSMRREITKARACEREAVENNKTVIATLSHDIKTPISSIQAYAEGLEANLDRTPEKRAKYLSVIIKKCGEVTKLTNDLFLHALSDLEKLRIFPERMELCGWLQTAVGEISAERADVRLVVPDFQADVMADRSRLMQIAENLINNARKYAKSDVEIRLTRQDGSVAMHVRDFGRGVPDEDLPFLFDKFYRGNNCGREEGSGLGLYIVKYLAEQMNGSVLLKNHPDGLEVVVSLPEISQQS